MDARVILLDALGTLVALQSPAPALVAELRLRWGLEVTLAEAERAFAAEMTYYRHHFDEGRDGPSVADLRGRCAQALAAALPDRGGFRRLPIPELTEALLASLRFDAFPDVQPALSALARRGCRLVVVSNWDASLPDVLARVGLAQLLDGIVTSAEVGARKPSPAIFMRALELAGASADEAVHVGDTVQDDVAGALATGIRPVLIRRARLGGGGGGGQVGPFAPDGVRTIAKLTELDA